MKKISALIVDDDKNNIEILEHFIKKYCPEIKALDSSSQKQEAIDMLKSKSYDIVFMDIILDQDTAFELLDEIKGDLPQIIFVSAFDQYAIKAFKYNAVDFLLKPIEIDKLIEAVNRAIEKSSTKKEYALHSSGEIQIPNNSYSPFNFVTISNINKVNLIKNIDILYCKSSGRYTEFHLINKVMLIASKSLGEYEAILQHKDFFRIHNSYMVNLNHLTNINKKSGNYCELKDGTELPISRRRYDKLLQHLNII